MDSVAAGGEEIIFREVQRFTPPWLWALLVMATVFAWFAFIYELFDSLSDSGQDGEIWITALVWVLVGIGLPALFITSKLVVEVRRDGLYYRYHPYHRGMHRIGLGEISKAEPRTYRPIKEFCGWGIRLSLKKGIGKAYSVYGNRGLQLELSNGKKILFGSQKAEELAAAVRAAMGR
jgi:Family of unknown function (DUF6141)